MSIVKFNFHTDMTRYFFEDSIANIAITSFKNNETEQFLEVFFGQPKSVPGGLAYDKICAYSGNNPRILRILANAVENELQMSGGVSQEDFADIIADTETDKEKVKMEKLLQKSILSLDPTEKVVLEAISLYPFHFTFNDVMDLLSIKKTLEVLLASSEKPPEYEETSMESFLTKCKCVRESLSSLDERALKKVNSTFTII